MSKKKAVFNWSGGKDSALALYKVLQEGEYEILSLLTTINKDTQKSSIHAVPVKYLHMQAKSIDLPLYIVALDKYNKTYEVGMCDAVKHFKAMGVTHFIFGDIFLQDVRSYREERLAPHGITVVEPLWGMGSGEVMRRFLLSGIQSKVVVIQADKLDKNYIGQKIDKDFVQTLPANVDVCGENGEYHSFVYDGPIFSYPIELPIQRPKLVSYEFNLEDGSVQTHKYWMADHM